MKTIIYIIMAMALMITTSLSAQNVGQVAPDFTLSNVDGGTFTLSEQKGKVVFIFTFGNTCPSCISNGPKVEQDIYQEYKTYSNFVAIGIDAWNGSAAKVHNFSVSSSVSFPLLLNGSSTISAYNTTYDRVIVIDQEGVIRYKSLDNVSTSEVNGATRVIGDLLQTASTGKIPNQKAFTAYFNSSSQQVVFNNPYSNVKSANVSLMDISGRILYVTKEFSLSEKNQFSFTPSSKGLYFLYVKNEEGRFLSKFLY